MPIYDYRCPKCGLEFEVSRSFSRATEPAMCPADGTESERLFRMPMTFVKGGTIGTGGGSAMPPEGADLGHDHGHTHGPGGHTH